MKEGILLIERRLEGLGYHWSFGYKANGPASSGSRTRSAGVHRIRQSDTYCYNKAGMSCVTARHWQPHRAAGVHQILGVLKAPVRTPNLLFSANFEGSLIVFSASLLKLMIRRDNLHKPHRS